VSALKKKALLLDNKRLFDSTALRNVAEGSQHIYYLAEYSRDMERAQAECTWLVSVCARSFYKGVPLCDKGSSREGLADGEEERRLGMGGHFLCYCDITRSCSSNTTITSSRFCDVVCFSLLGRPRKIVKASSN